MATPATTRGQSRPQAADAEHDRRGNQQTSPAQAVGQDPAGHRPGERPEQDRADDDLLHAGREGERLLHEQDRAGDDADVVPEQHPAQRGDGGRQVDGVSAAGGL
jgi:hypothetical protein